MLHELSVCDKSILLWRIDYTQIRERKNLSFSNIHRHLPETTREGRRQAETVSLTLWGIRGSKCIHRQHQLLERGQAVDKVHSFQQKR